MKQAAAFLFSALIALSFAADLRAAEEAAKPGQAAVQLQVGSSAGWNAAVVSTASGGAAVWYIQYMDKIVGLTALQKTTMTEIIEARDKAMKDFQIQYAEDIKAAGNVLRETYATKDKDAIANAQKTYQELFAPMHEIMRKSQNDLANVLTPEQKSALHNYQLMNSVKGMTSPVELSEDQIRQIKEACPEGDPQGFGGKLQKVLQEVMTPEQKTQRHDFLLMNAIKSMTSPVQLREDQIQQIKESSKEGDLLRGFGGKLQQTIQQVMTPEQKAQRHDFLLMNSIKSMTAPVQLGEDQIRKIKEVCKEGDLQAFGSKLQQTIQQVLTPEQKASIVRNRATSYVKAVFGRAQLTADQLHQIEAFCDILAKEQTFNLNDGKLYVKLAEKANQLLTDAQKEAMKNATASWGIASGLPGSSLPGAPAGKAPDKKP